jgi:hypothetical protein
MPAETLPASATTCTTLDLHYRFICALQRPLDRSIRGLLGPYDMGICRYVPASVVATGHRRATRSDRGRRRASSRPCRRDGRQAVCAPACVSPRFNCRGTRASVPPELSFCPYIQSHLSSPADPCALLLDGRITPHLYPLEARVCHRD